MAQATFPGLSFCVCGGGSLAHAVATVLAASPMHRVSVLSRHAKKWSGTLVLNYRNQASVVGRPALVSDDPAEVIPQADVVFVIVPHAVREQVLAAIAPHVQSHAWVGALPGFAGFAWTARYYLGPEIKLFGTQRVPYVCRKINYGSEVLVTGIRPRNYVAALPAQNVNVIAEIMRQAMNLYMIPVSNYMNICFSRSNSVFHPARLYGLCKDWDGGEEAFFTSTQNFYSDWDDCSSEIFFGLDEEMCAAAKALPLDLNWAHPVMQHYEIAFKRDLTAKIRSIEALADRAFPMLPVDGGFIPDRNSYYFTEDLVYGLSTLKAIFSVAGIESPVTDKILRWSKQIMGEHTGQMPWPQRFGLDTVEKLSKFCVDGKL